MHNGPLNLVADLAPVGIFQVNSARMCVYVNERWSQICGMAREEALGRGWIRLLHSEDAEAVLYQLNECVAKGIEISCQFRLRTSADQSAVWVRACARPVYTHGEQDGFIATLTDITHHHETQEKLRAIAETDALTGLANRVVFFDRLECALKRVNRHGAVVVLYLDLDGFKAVNDTLGHDNGDRLLRQVAARLTKCLRNEDTVARLGGDEFTVLMQDVSNTQIASTIAEKLLKILACPIELEGHEVFVTTSIGIVYSINHRETAGNLLKRADIALYQAKAAGRNTYQFYSPGLARISQKRLYLANSLHRALDRNQLSVHYQLQGDLKTNEVKGFESLLRWHHPERGRISPGEFIPLLEDNGLILPVGRWVLRTACHQYRSWLDQGLVDNDSHMSINLSARQIRDRQLLMCVESIIAETRIENLVFEITESVLFEDFRSTRDVFMQLKDLGVLIALDDFGTGYSSLSYLKKIPIDLIKIDHSFIRDLVSDPEDAAITKAVIALSKSLNLKVVAEGVDNQEKLDYLRKMGCDWYQGYYLAKPKPAEEVFSTGAVKRGWFSV